MYLVQTMPTACQFKMLVSRKLLKPVQVQSPLQSVQFHQTPLFSDLADSYCKAINMEYSNCSSDDIQWHSYLSSNFIQFS